ncbi:SpoIIE family protein phosphatase [Pseudonocardia sp. GCM10023141]|uniref:SpoIIE family protein phosphatase n=1 Tax=Pseudonocardia sp. GCM10023141 TaxID=3252653 RepID=UPI003605F754
MDRSDDALAGVVDALPAGIFAVDASGRIVVWSAGAEALTGWTREDLLGLDTSNATPGPTVDLRALDRILAELRAGRPFSGRVPALPRTGRTVWFRATPGPAGSFVGLLQDVGDTAAEDEAFALLDALWKTAPVGLAYFDTELRYRRVNEAVLDIDGGSVDARIGRTLEDVHGPVGAAIAAGLRAVLTDGKARADVPVRGRLWHGNGPFQEWRMYYYPVRSADGAIVGVGVVLVDVTEDERTRRELEALATEREHALNRYQSLVAATSAAVWIRAADGSAATDAPALRAITGQREDEHDGWGFLDAVHPAHRESVGAAWRAAAVADPPEVFARVYRLRTESGYRWFRTRAVPVHAGGRVVEWVGTEADIDDAIRARDRLEVLADATLAMKAALEPEGELEALAAAVVPEFADLCRVYLLDPPIPGSDAVTGRRSVMRIAPGIPESPSDEDRFVFGADHPIARSARTAAPVRVAAPAEPAPMWRAPAAQQQWGSDVTVHSMLVAPVVSRGVVVASLLFLGCGDRPRYTDDDLALVGELAERASAAVDMAVTYQQSRQVSVALQSAMLSEPPVHPGVRIVARYLPAAAGLQVGGDWYDAFPLPGGDLAVGVGDVVGHDLPAAMAMGQLRSMLRGLAHDSVGAPSDVVSRLDRVACGLGVTRFTTLIYGRIGWDAEQPVFRWSNAGHPVPLLVDAAGEPRLLPGGADVVLGVDPDAARRDHEVRLTPGDTLLLYTDGLVERRRDPDDEASELLLDLVREAAGLTLEQFCDHIVRGSRADTGDDVVVLALRIAP